MTDKELLKQLNSLKTIKMATDVKESNKKTILTQISNTISQESGSQAFSGFSFYFKNILSLFTKPAMVFSGFILFLVASLFLGNNFYKNSKPTDSLYIARVISEKARLNTTFRQCDRERLEIEFASNRASDIAVALMNPELNTEKNKNNIEKLTVSFKNELAKVKTKVSEIEKPVKEDSEPSGEGSVFSANSLKENNGIEIALPIDDHDGEVIIREGDLDEEELEATAGEAEKAIIDDAQATTSSEQVLEEELESEVEALSEVVESSIDSPSDKKNKQALAEEIEQLFDEGRLDEVIIKLKEIKK